MANETIYHAPTIITSDHLAQTINDHFDSSLTLLWILDPGLKASAYVQKNLDELSEMGFKLEVFWCQLGEPSYKHIEKTAQWIIEQAKPPFYVLGMGGGSVLDTCKIAIGYADEKINDHSCALADFALAKKPFTYKRHFSLIPTTAGTGSEATRTAIASNDAHQKLWFWDDCFLPQQVILDASLTTSLPKNATIASGLDAFVHAFEALCGQRSNGWSQALAQHAITVIIESLPLLTKQPENLMHRQKMLEASCMAGMAIEQSGTGIAHNIAHALANFTSLPHGVAVTMATDALMSWNTQQASHASLNWVNNALNVAGYEGDLDIAFSAFITTCDFYSLPSLYANNVIEPDLLIKNMMLSENAPMLKNNVRIPSTNQLSEVAQLFINHWQKISKVV